MMKSNCLLYAIRKVWRVGGNFIIRSSPNWFGGFHIMWRSRTGRVWGFDPKDGSWVGVRRFIRDKEWLFKGRVKKEGSDDWVGDMMDELEVGEKDYSCYCMGFKFRWMWVIGREVDVWIKWVGFGNR